jgi:hypothetical protein
LSLSDKLAKMLVTDPRDLALVCGRQLDAFVADIAAIDS